MWCPWETQDQMRCLSPTNILMQMKYSNVIIKASNDNEIKEMDQNKKVSTPRGWKEGYKLCLSPWWDIIRGLLVYEHQVF